MGPLQRAFPDCPVCSSNPKPSSPSSYHHFLRALITTIITMAFLCGHAYCPAWGPHVGQGLGLSPSALAHVPGLCGPRYNYSQVSIKETDWLTDCSAETQSWLLFGKIWGSSECQLVKVTEEPLDHSKETGILLLLKPIHVSDAFPVRDKCKLLTGILLYAKKITYWGYCQTIAFLHVISPLILHVIKTI